VSDDPGDAWITKRAGAGSPVEVLFDLGWAVVGEEDFLLRQKICSRAPGGLQYPMALDDLFEYMRGQRICKVECDEIKAFLLLPMWKPSTVPNAHLAEARPNSPLHCGRR